MLQSTIDSQVHVPKGPTCSRVTSMLIEKYWKRRETQDMQGSANAKKVETAVLRRVWLLETIRGKIKGRISLHSQSNVLWVTQEMNEGEEDEEELQARLSSALCTLAETHMGQANEVSDVAEECEALLLRAAQADPTSPEPMQVSHF